MSWISMIPNLSVLIQIHGTYIFQWAMRFHKIVYIDFVTN